MIDLALLTGGKLEKQNIQTKYEVVLFVEKAKDFQTAQQIHLNIIQTLSAKEFKVVPSSKKLR